MSGEREILYCMELRLTAYLNSAIEKSIRAFGKTFSGLLESLSPQRQII